MWGFTTGIGLTDDILSALGDFIGSRSAEGLGWVSVVGGVRHIAPSHGDRRRNVPLHSATASRAQRSCRNSVQKGEVRSSSRWQRRYVAPSHGDKRRNVVLHAGRASRTRAAQRSSSNTELIDCGTIARGRSVGGNRLHLPCDTSRCLTVTRPALFGLCHTFRLGVQAELASARRPVFSLEIHIRRVFTVLCDWTWRRGRAGRKG